VGNFKVSGTLGGKTVTVPIERAVDQMLCRELDEKFTREAGYQGGKTALYALVAAVRPKQIKPLIRFEGLPGEFSQHDFGEVAVTFLDGSIHRIHFFASRLKYSRFICVSVVQDQAVESLVRNLAEHLDRWGGAPLMCVFDRPKTVALKWQRNGEVTEWNPVFAYVMLELGVGVELCWPHSPQQKGAVENLVGFVKSSFFKVRRFHDQEDLAQQLIEWHREVNQERACRIHLDGPSGRTRHLNPEETLPEDTKRLRISGIGGSEFPEPTGRQVKVGCCG